MAEPLKNHFDHRVARTLARELEAAWPPFRAKAFLSDALSGFDELELMDRGRHLGGALGRHLPPDFEEACAIVMRSISDRPARGDGDGGMASFFYLPHVNFVAERGLEDFETSMRALHALTQRFTGEFSIRPFIIRHERAALTRLRKWTRDDNEHVRRLVSEGTRPRLPWASRLPRFQADPAPVLELLERLKDDPSEYVRRSVANNLNDIGKDHPALLVEVARRWLPGASPERAALVRHALRSLVKRGDADALTLLGFGSAAVVALEQVELSPARVAIGGKVRLSFTVRSRARHAQRVLVDLRVHFVKASGAPSPKVFKLKAIDLDAGARVVCRKTISLAVHTTRRPYAGEHVVEALVNGRARPLGAFVVLAPSGRAGTRRATSRRAPPAAPRSRSSAS